MSAIQKFNEIFRLMICPGSTSGINSTSDKTNELFNGKYKGFFYKIQNSESQTIGYLFGVLHNITIDFQNELHPKIDDYLRRSKTLWVELDLLDTQTLTDHYRNLGLPEQILHVEVDKYIKEQRTKPSGVDTFLTLRAESLNIGIESLETEDSRKESERVTASEKELLFRRMQTRIQGLAYLAKFHLEGNQNSEIEKFTIGLKYLLRAFVDCRHTFMNTDYGSSEKANIVKCNFLLLVRYKKYLDNINPEKVTGSLNEVVSDFHSFVKKQVEYSLSGRDEWKEKLDLTWGRGDEEAHSKLREGDNLYANLEKKEVFERDTFILNRMHENLLRASKENRSFYALGSTHLVGNYHNLRQRLRDLGWKVVKAYKE